MSKIILLEDEQLIAENLQLILIELGHEVIAIVNNSADLFEFLMHETPDLLLLDIELQQSLDGIDVASELNRRYDLPFLFVSSKMSDDIIERAKFTQPLGFISKPFSPATVKTQLSLALHKLNTSPSKNTQEELYVKDNGELLKLKFDDILFVQALDNYSVIQLEDRRIIYSLPLKSLVARMEKSTDNFYRIHRSYFINLAQINRVGNNHVVLLNGTELSISDSKKAGLIAKLNLL